MSNVPSEQPQSVPGDTTPTWEMELLVSGATVFGLMQLPQLIDHGYFRLMDLSPQEYTGLLTPLWIYSKVATISLVVTFVVHLCLRGYWVALVGMNSVYPGGIRWQNLRIGSIERARAEPPSMASTVERADNRATRVFAVGFGFAMLMLKFALGVMLLLATCVLFDAAAGGGHARTVFITVIVVVAAPMLLAALAFRAFGYRLAPEHPLRRAISTVLRVYGRLGMGQRGNPLIALFISHEGRPKAVVVFLLLLLPIMAVIMLQNSLLRGRLPMGLFVGISTDNPYSAAMSPNAFYADAAGDRMGKLPLPHIPGRVAQGAYLPLFVPFIPRLHGPALQAACPETLAIATEPAATRARLSCLGQLSDIRIDGAAAAVELQATTDPDTDQPGMIAMLPIAALAPGRHELSLGEPARDSLDPAKPFRRYRISFWK